MRRSWIIFIFFVLLFFGFIGWGFLVVGGGSYKLIENKIEKFDDKVKETAEQEFYVRGKDNNTYAGTVANINKQGAGGVLIWSNKGLRYFQSDEHTVYSYYDVCQAYRNNPQQMRVDDGVRTVTADIESWAELVKAGDFIQITVATPAHGGTVGNLREAIVYSQPLFLSMQLGSVCAK